MKKIILSCAVIALVALGCDSDDVVVEPLNVTQGSYTMAEVQAANSTTKCWSVINGAVYDLTTWISKHPGGEKEIEAICGKDGTAAFKKQHSSQREPNEDLSKFQIGTLKQ